MIVRLRQNQQVTFHGDTVVRFVGFGPDYAIIEVPNDSVPQISAGETVLSPGPPPPGDAAAGSPADQHKGGQRCSV